jgi:hypothetical protein
LQFPERRKRRGQNDDENTVAHAPEIIRESLESQLHHPAEQLSVLYLVPISLLLNYSSATLRDGQKSLARKLRKRATDLLARLDSGSMEQIAVSVSDLRAARWHLKISSPE